MLKKIFYGKLPASFISLLFIFLAAETVFGNETNNYGRAIMQKAWDAYRIPDKGEVEEFEIFTFKSALNYTPEQARGKIDGRNVLYKKASRQIMYTKDENKIRITFHEPASVRNTDFIIIHSLINESKGPCCTNP